MSERSSKIILGLLLAVLFVTLTSVFLMQKGSKETRTIDVPVTQSLPSTNETAAPETPSFKPVSSFLSPKEIQQQLKAVQDQINAGILSPEEGQKQKDAIGIQTTPPVGAKE